MLSQRTVPWFCLNLGFVSELNPNPYVYTSSLQTEDSCSQENLPHCKWHMVPLGKPWKSPMTASQWPTASGCNARCIACWGGRPWKRPDAKTSGSCSWSLSWLHRQNANCCSYQGRIRETPDLAHGPEFGPCWSVPTETILEPSQSPPIISRRAMD